MSTSIYMANKMSRLQNAPKNTIVIGTLAIIPGFFIQIYISSYFMSSKGV
jgi:hypothetical protein